MVRRSAELFHDMYQPGKKMYACIHEDEFAMWFAGTKGLPEIKRLSQDESLIPPAQNIASNLYIHISSGQHLPSFRFLIANHSHWIGRLFFKSLVKSDMAYLKRHDLSTPIDKLKQVEQDGGEERR